jgi:hypothetical protein
MADFIPNQCGKCSVEHFACQQSLCKETTVKETLASFHEAVPTQQQQKLSFPTKYSYLIVNKTPFSIK